MVFCSKPSTKNNNFLLLRRIICQERIEIYLYISESINFSFCAAILSRIVDIFILKATLVG